MATERPHLDTHSLAQLTDSPWFWVCVFSAMALAGTIALAPKYEARQRGIELRFEARQRSQEFSDRVEAAGGDSDRVRSEMMADREYEAYDMQRELFVRLTPILLLLSVLFLTSLARVARLQTKSNGAAAFDPLRAILLLLAIAYCGLFVFSMWSTHWVDPGIQGEFAISQYRAWATGRGMKSLLIFLLGSILVAIAVGQLWKKKTPRNAP